MYDRFEIASLINQKRQGNNRKLPSNGISSSRRRRIRRKRPVIRSRYNKTSPYISERKRSRRSISMTRNSTESKSMACNETKSDSMTRNRTESRTNDMEMFIKQLRSDCASAMVSNNGISIKKENSIEGEANNESKPITHDQGKRIKQFERFN